MLPVPMIRGSKGRLLGSSRLSDFVFEGSGIALKDESSVSPQRRRLPPELTTRYHATMTEDYRYIGGSPEP